jgi:uncharacterized protein YbjQ (UPF0145 family)
MWQCVKCREKLEDDFEVCWKCGTSRDGVEDPEFRIADETHAEDMDEPYMPNAKPVADESTAIRVASDDNARRREHYGEPMMITTTGNEIAGCSITSYLGIVRGIVVRSPGIAQGILGGLQEIVGGNIEAYTEVCEAARDEAYQRMVKHAQEKGADAIIAMRYDATEFSEGVTEVLAYGTAVKLTRD